MSRYQNVAALLVAGVTSLGVVSASGPTSAPAKGPSHPAAATGGYNAGVLVTHAPRSADSAGPAMSSCGNMDGGF